MFVDAIMACMVPCDRDHLDDITNKFCQSYGLNLLKFMKTKSFLFVANLLYGDICNETSNSLYGFTLSKGKYCKT